MKRAVATFVLWAYALWCVGAFLDYAVGFPSAPFAAFGVVMGLLAARIISGRSVRPTKAMLDRLPHSNTSAPAPDGTGLFV